MTLEFWQIIFRDEQEKDCYPFAKIYRNVTLTPYFENTVIQELVSGSLGSIYIGVASHALKKKRQDGSTPQVLRNDLELSEAKILCHDFDVAILCPSDPAHEIMENASLWHGKAWDEAIKEFANFMPIQQKLYNPIYGNHFIARREIYQQYVRECLSPAIQFMESREVFRAPSGYREKKERLTRGTTIVSDTMKKLSEYRGYPVFDWEIGVFVLERLFRFWIEGKNYRVINL